MIDDATIKRAAGFHNVERCKNLLDFARAIEQLARDEQREADAKLCENLVSKISDPLIIGFDRADGGTNALNNAAKAIRFAAEIGKGIK